MILRESSKNGSSIVNIKSQKQLNISQETVRIVLNSSSHLNYVKLARIPHLNTEQIQKVNVCYDSSNLES